MSVGIAVKAEMKKKVGEIQITWLSFQTERKQPSLPLSEK